MQLPHAIHPSDVDLATLDLTDAGLYSNGNPHAIWHYMRHHTPVHWQSTGAHGFWSITRYDVAYQVLRDFTSFTSQRGTMLSVLGVGDPAAGAEMTVTDPPRHTQMRAPLQHALSAKSLQHHEARIRDEIRKLLAPARAGGTVDIASLAMKLSATVACILIGLPLDDRDLLSRLAIAAIAPDDHAFRMAHDATRTLEETHRQLFGYFHEAIARARRYASDTLLERLLAIRLDGKPLDEVALVSNCYSLLLGATVTTPQVISGTLLELIGTDRYEEWARHPELLASGVEEALRWTSPANHFMRYTTRPTELSGVRIAEGMAVVAWLGSANRDEAVFEDPYRFDPRRQPNRHVAFGVGPHHCIGHAAARLALRLAFEEIFRCFRGFDLAGPVAHLRSNFIAGIRAMPVLPHPRD